MTELNQLLLFKSNISQQTQKNYERIYNKIRDKLSNDIADTNQNKIIEIIEKLSNENPSNFLTYINVPIIIKKMTNNDVDLLVKVQKEYDGLRTKHIQNSIKQKKVELPDFNVLKKFTDELYDKQEYQKYIINFILINFGLRNKDLQLYIVERNSIKNTEVEQNFILLQKSKAELIINNYKTIENYGQKKIKITNKKFIDACYKYGVNSYLLNDNGDKSKPVVETGLAQYIGRRLYNGLTEGDYFKILIKNAQKKKNSLKEIQFLSETRGTSLDVIMKHYNIQV